MILRFLIARLPDDEDEAVKRHRFDIYADQFSRRCGLVFREKTAIRITMVASEPQQRGEHAVVDQQDEHDEGYDVL